MANSRPILFSGAMVRAILENSKTQTRRIVKPQPTTEIRSGMMGYWSIQPDVREFSCPYGQPGDRLWVRETWQAWAECDKLKATQLPADAMANLNFPANGNTWPSRIRSSIHMPRWASRITLEITGVRVEKLQGISESDAIAEGCSKNHNGYYWGGPHAVSGLKQMATAKSAYNDLWTSINGPDSWAANPWVWVVEFKKVAP